MTWGKYGKHGIDTNIIDLFNYTLGLVSTVWWVSQDSLKWNWCWKVFGDKSCGLLITIYLSL